MRVFVTAATLTLAIMSVPSGAAGPAGVEPERVARALRTAGYTVSDGVGRDGEGNPKFALSIDGASFDLVLNCTEDQDCRSYELRTGYNLNAGSTPEKMSEWNRGDPFAHADLDRTNDPFLIADVRLDIAGGITDPDIIRSVRRFAAEVPKFEALIGWGVAD